MKFPLTRGLKEQEAEIAKIILDAVSVEKIYLLASSLLQEQIESVFPKPIPVAPQVSHYWLLILIESAGSDRLHAAQDKIENACRSVVPVTAFILDPNQFNSWLSEGHPFACSVVRSAALLHGSSHLSPAEVKPMDEESLKKANEALIAQSLDKAASFLAGAELLILRKQNRVAAFMLHQAAEQSLLAILKAATGLRGGTHNIDKLIWYCSMVAGNAAAIFQRGNEKDQRLLRLLQRAYIESRYKEDFTVSSTDLDIIFHKIKSLRQIMRGVAFIPVKYIF